MAKVSVIVPVYKVENFIEKCARSLFEQTLNDIEYIFIDDCTPDKSIEKLEMVVSEYHQRLAFENKIVRIVRMPSNQGSFAVRKKGIELSVGEYIIHCDSDDWVDVNMYGTMYKKAVSTNADIVVCDYISTDGINYNKRYNGGVSSSKNEILLHMLQAKISWSMCNKLISRKLYERDIIYPKYSNGEDMVIILQLIYYASKIEYLPNPYYYYLKNTASITRNTSESLTFNRFMQGVKNVKVIERFFQDKLNGRLYRDAIDNMKFIQLRLIEPLLCKNRKKYIKIWKMTFPELKFRLWRNGNVGFRNKIKYYLFFIGINK